MDIRGNGGRLLVGPYQAARLGSWTLSRSGGDYTLNGEVVQPDAYWGLQPVSTVAIAMGQRAWVWRAVTATLREGSVTANLRGAPETEAR